MQQPPIPKDSLDDTQTVLISSHVLIRDAKTKQILVNQRDS
jgi:hypothetical protein